jgi:hypothetical protein
VEGNDHGLFDGDSILAFAGGDEEQLREVSVPLTKKLALQLINRDVRLSKGGTSATS